MNSSLPLQWFQDHGLYLLEEGALPRVAFSDTSDELLLALLQVQLGARVEPVEMASEKIRAEVGLAVEQTT